ncbi:hypothetical protein [Streptomyces sp. NPDC088752]|uniref:phage baseplate protein n=1 Tax=Streptomyces sp. NPDC088752 TaxID=3154963 RepID=UPI00344263E0
MERCHLYLPLVDSSGAAYSYAEVTLLDSETGRPVDEPVYLEPRGGAPQDWPILCPSGVIDVWTDWPLRVTVQALLPGNSTFTRTHVDIAPAPSATVRSTRPLSVSSNAGVDGNAILALSSGGHASWQVVDALRYHRHDGAAPGSTAITPSSPYDIYASQTRLGTLQGNGAAQGSGASALGSSGSPSGADATVLGQAAGGAGAVAVGKNAQAGAVSVAVGSGATAPGERQVALGPESVLPTGAPAGVAVGKGAVGASGATVQVSDGISLAPAVSAIGKGTADLSWLPFSEYLALFGNAVAPRHLSLRGDGVIAGASSTLGVYGGAGSTQPIISTSGLSSSAPGRTALLSMLAALDRLGLVYLVDGAIDDELADWTKTFARSANTSLETGDDGSKAGDTTRARRSTTAAGTITYQLATQEIGDFALRVFAWASSGTPTPQSEITVEVSANNSTWTSVPLAWQTLEATSGGWHQTWVRCRTSLPVGMSYLRITLNAASSATTPQIGRAIVRPRRTLATKTPRFVLSGSGSTLLDGVAGSQASTPIQGMGIDSVNNEVYFSQIIQGETALPGENDPLSLEDRVQNGDVVITRMSLSSKQVLGVMYVKGAGQGTTVSVENATDGVWLWIDAAASSTGRAQAIARVRFQKDTVLDGQSMAAYRPFGALAPGQHLFCAVDNSSGRVMIRCKMPAGASTYRFFLYSLTEFKAGSGAATPLAILDQEADSAAPDGRSVGTYQGGTTWGNYLYTYEGQAGVDNHYLTCQDWRTGQVVERQKRTSFPALEAREPQGLSLSIDPTTQSVKLACALSGGPEASRVISLLTLSETV